MLDALHGYLGFVDVGKAFAEEGLPFLPENEHEGGVAGWGVERAEWHDVPSLQ